MGWHYELNDENKDVWEVRGETLFSLAFGVCVGLGFGWGDWRWLLVAVGVVVAYGVIGEYFGWRSWGQRWYGHDRWYEDDRRWRRVRTEQTEELLAFVIGLCLGLAWGWREPIWVVVAVFLLVVTSSIFSFFGWRLPGEWWGRR